MRTALWLLALTVILGCKKDTDTDPKPEGDADTDADSDADADADAFEHTGVDGRFYRLGLGQGDWIQPDEAPIGVTPLLVGVANVTASSVDFFFAFPEGKSNTQNLCLATHRLPSGTLDGAGRFSVGPTDWVQQVEGGAVTAYGFEFKGQFWVDGDGSNNVHYATTSDFRESAPLLGQTAADVCSVLANGTRPCEACPSDSAVYCHESDVDNVPMQDVGVTSLVERSVAQVAADSNCP